MGNGQKENNLTQRRQDAKRHLEFIGALLLVCFAWLLCLYFFERNQPRLLPSWHGFLHSAIASRFVEATFPPENPFFAGEKLPYYWFYHYCGYLLSMLANIDLLHAFRWIGTGGLLILLTFSGLIGYKHRGSIAAGLLIGYLSLVGVNPFGPLIALAKQTIRGNELTDNWSRETPVDTTFISNRFSDDLMSKPLLPALYIGSDWRNGQNMAWFFDVSSRGSALAILPVLLYIFLRPKRPFLVILFSAIASAFNPVVGFALSAGIALTGFIQKPFSYRSLLPFVGFLVAAPTYYHILLMNSGTVNPTPSVTFTVIKLGAIAANFVVLLPLSILGSRERNMRNLTIAGCMALALFPFVIIAPKNTHNLSNVAQALLAVPAGAYLSTCKRWIQIAVVLLFLPMTGFALWSYQDRPALPLATQGRTLHRIPENHPLEKLYTWIREQTPQNSVILIDPDRVVKMSGNVSELPAFTSRVLFVDQESYLTQPFTEADYRTALSRNASRGKTLTAEQLRYLRDLKRPLYIATFTGRDLSPLYGAPLFSSGSVALYQLK